MTVSHLDRDRVLTRARQLRRASLDAVCEVIEPWPYGIVARAPRYPHFFDFNVVEVDRPTPMSVDDLIAFADQALAGMSHRRIDFESADLGGPLRAEFERRGWRTLRLLWMHHQAELPAGPEAEVEEVPYDAVHHLRVAWHEEDFPGVESAQFHDSSREVALTHGARVLTVVGEGGPLAYAQIEPTTTGSEISEVYVAREHRGRGIGTALTRAAIREARDGGDLWICADDDNRPKRLYARLGFRPVWTTIQFLRLP